MATYTIYSDTADGYLESFDATYATARAGSGSINVDTTSTSIYVGQLSGTYYCIESFVSFDTSSVVGVVSSATLSLYGKDDGSATDFTMTAATRDWGATLTTGDFVAGASLSGLTTVATFATSGFSIAGYNVFTSTGSFLSAINIGGTTRLIVYSSRHSGNNTPTGNEYVGCYSADQTGTTNDPRLVVVAAPAGPPPRRHIRPYYIWRR